MHIRGDFTAAEKNTLLHFSCYPAPVHTDFLEKNTKGISIFLPFLFLRGAAHVVTHRSSCPVYPPVILYLSPGPVDCKLNYPSGINKVKS